MYNELFYDIPALGDKPGLKQTKVDTLPPATDLFAQNTKVGRGNFQREQQGKLLFS